MNLKVLQPLNLPKAALKLTKSDGKIYVWCILRKKRLVVTPEEWVRQHVIHYLVGHLGFPEERLVAEMGIKVNDMIRRCDLVAIDKMGTAKLIVECTATSVPVTEATLFQAGHYHKELKVDYLLLTNGLQHEFLQIDHQNGELQKREDWEFLKEWI